MSKILFLKSLSFSYIRQIVTLVVGVLSVPLMLNYFGVTLFAIWALILGLAGYLNNIAFGIPTAMSTLVAKTISNIEKFNILKKSTMILGSISFIFLIVFVLVVELDKSWIISFLGNIETQYVDVSIKLFIVFVIITLIKIPLNLYYQYFVGMNLVYISEIYQTLNVSFGFLVLLITIYAELNIYDFALYTLLSQVFLNVISVLHVLLKFRKYNTKSDNDKIVRKQILKSGFAFFQVGIAASIVWSTDNLIISHYLSAEDVTPYTIAFKMFTYIFIFSAMINGVIGPMYGNAYANNDFKKINFYANSILKLLVVIGGFVWFSLVFFAKDVILLWTGNEKAFGGYLLIFALGLYGFVLSFVNTYATIIFSLNLANKALSIAWSEAVLNLFISILLVNYLGLGGVALGTALAAFISGFLFLPKIIKKLTENKIIFDYVFTKKHFIRLVFPIVLLSLLTINIDRFIFKLIIYIPAIIIYIFFTWKLLDIVDKNTIINIFKKKRTSNDNA